MKARTVLEELDLKQEETMKVKEEPSTEEAEVMMVKVLAMNHSYIKLQ